MPGCNGACSFSLERNDLIKCEGDCKTGYIESSEGVCELCNNVNRGCYQCHYEDKYPSDYLGIKRKRRFICDYCEENNEFKCKKCFYNYYLNEDGKCNYCGANNQIIIDNNKCIQCNDSINGGIEGCQYCEINDNQTICRVCQEGYILLSDNNTCLNLSKNKELKQFDKCEQISLDNNKNIYCSRCKNYDFSLLKENNEEKCIFIPTLSGNYDRDYYYNRLYYDNNNDYDIDYIYNYYYYNYIYRYFYPCLEAINLGTADNPLYSCNKCYNLYEYDKLYINQYTLIAEEKTNINYCINSNHVYSLQNCSEARFKIKGRNIKYSCAKCIKDNNLVYNSIDDVNYCQSLNTTSKCMVKYCKTCKSGNNYFCDSCLVSDYIVNSLTGSCMKKTEFVPVITWKDIFRLELNSEKQINGRNIHGPKLFLR